MPNSSRQHVYTTGLCGDRRSFVDHTSSVAVSNQDAVPEAYYSTSTLTPSDKHCLISKAFQDIANTALFTIEQNL